MTVLLHSHETAWTKTQIVYLRVLSYAVSLYKHRNASHTDMHAYKQANNKEQHIG